MSSSTSNRGYIIQTSGENAGTWGLDPGLNGSFQAIDTNLGGVTTVTLSSSNVTLSSTQYANGTIILSGTLTANVLVVFPAIQAWFTIFNQTTGSFTATLASQGATEAIAIEQGAIADILINGTQVKFRNLPPVGTYLDVADATVPAWITACTVPPYLICDGSTFSAVTYPYLNTKLGTTTLPDLRGRSRFYLNGGTSRITSGISGIDGNTRFSGGGDQLLQTHTHANSLNDPGHTHAQNIFYYTSVQGGTGASGVVNVVLTGSTTTFTTNSSTTNVSITNASGGSGSSQNMPPACISGITLIRAA